MLEVVSTTSEDSRNGWGLGDVVIILQTNEEGSFHRIVETQTRHSGMYAKNTYFLKHKQVRRKEFYDACRLG